MVFFLNVRFSKENSQRLNFEIVNCSLKNFHENDKKKVLKNRFFMYKKIFTKKIGLNTKFNGLFPKRISFEMSCLKASFFKGKKNGWDKRDNEKIVQN